VPRGRRDRGHDDDPPAATRDHVDEDCLGHFERAKDVDLEEPPYTVHRYVGERSGLAYSRVVNQHVDRQSWTLSTSSVVMSSFSTRSDGTSRRSSLAWSSVSVVAMTW